MLNKGKLPLQVWAVQEPAAVHRGGWALPDLRGGLERHQVRPALLTWLLWRGL